MCTWRNQLKWFRFSNVRYSDCDCISFPFQELFTRLLQHRCPVCDKNEEKGNNGKEKEEKRNEKPDDYPEEGGRQKPAPGRKKLQTFQNFRQLDKHVRVEHDLYYCDLCSGHLKVT